MTYPEYRAAKYFPALDGIRAVSVLLVVSYHVPNHAFGAFAGFLGVTLFFVISGFLITTLALREEEDRGRLNLKAFYIRRTFRILPLYYVALATYAAFYGTVGNADSARAFFDRKFEYLFYFQEVSHARQIVTGSLEAPFDHSWSLGIEEKFYLVWPFLIFWLLRGMRGWRLGVALFCTLAFTLTPLLKEVDQPIAAFCLHPYSHILVGCCLALLLHDPYWYRQLEFLGKLHFVLLVMLAFGMAHYAMPNSAALGFGSIWQNVYSVLGAMLIVVVFLRRGPLYWFLTLRPVLWIGTLSYGIYLFHFVPLLIAERALKPRLTPEAYPYASWGFSVALSVLVAWGLSIVVEKPMIKIGRRWAGHVMGKPTLASGRA